MDYTAITGAVDFAGALVAVGVVAGALGLVYVGIKGSKIVLGFLR